MIKIDKNSPRPLYEQLTECLRAAVAAGQWAPESAIPEERELAARLQISRMTVRRAIVALTSEGVFRRIRGRGTFVIANPKLNLANANATTTATAGAARPFTIGIVAPFGQATIASKQFYFRIFQGMQEALSAQPAGSMSLVFRELRAPYGPFVAELNTDMTLDYVVVLGVADAQALAALAAVRQPVVLVDSSWSRAGKAVDRVRLENRASSAAAVRHLIHLGHRDIGLFNFLPDTPAAQQRREAFLGVLEEHEIAPRPDRVYLSELNSTAAYAVMDGLFRQPPAQLPTAFFCASDELAVALIAAAQSHGHRVPDQFSVTSFGDQGLFTWPPLSTVRIPMEAMGRQAMELIARRRAQPEAPVIDKVLATEFIERGSCAPCREPAAP